MRHLYSFLIPTYRRLATLTESVNSIQRHCSSLISVEILLRVTDTDEETVRALPGLLKLPNLRVHIGPRNKGYMSLCEYHNELACIATGDWLWQWNDDVMMLTQNWDQLLEKHLANESAIYQPETHKLGGSAYRLDGRCPFFMMHRKHWARMVGECNLDYYGAMSDTMAFEFAARHLMPTVFVPGLSLHHIRDTEEKIAATRA